MALERLNHKWLLIEECPVAELSKSRGLSDLTALRVSLHFSHQRELQDSLDGLNTLLETRTTTLCLLQVKYTAETLSKEARQVHQAFANAHPQVSTYLPLCLPPSPLGDQVTWATPHQCETCLFFEAKRCGGLTGEERRHDEQQQRALLAGGALSQEWPEVVTLEHINQELPVCYWWPSPHLTSRLKHLLSESQSEVLWDLGGGNGFLAWLLGRGQAQLKTYNIDPVSDIYPARPEFYALPITAEEALTRAMDGRLMPPDVILISWPTTGFSHRKLVNTLQPRLIIRATDDERVCGVRRGHRAIEIKSGIASIFALKEGFNPSEGGDEYDDLDTPYGYELVLDEPVWAHRDLNRGISSPSGQLKVFRRLS